MSYIFKDREAPPAWREFKRRAPHLSLTPFYALSWLADWAAYSLGKWPVIELLEYLGSFSILFAAIVYFLGAPDRLKQKHYQAWQVINTAEGKGGNGGRIDALQELNHDHVSLVGVNVAGAYLQGLHLEAAQARRAAFSQCDLRDSDFQRADLPDTDFNFANLRRADLHDANLVDANFTDSDLVSADLSGADLNGATLDRANLRDANLAGIKDWQAVKSMDKVNILGAHNAPVGFIEWARKNGAVEMKTD